MLKMLTPRLTTVAGALVALAMSLQTFSPAQAQVGKGQYPDEADKIHLILLVAGYSDGIGGPCLNDCKAIKATLEASLTKKQLAVYDFTGKNPKTDQWYTPKEVIETVKGMRVGKNDSVFIYHSGHGEIGDRKQPEASHRLFIDKGQITRMQLQKPIEAMQPRSIIFLTDCCSNFREFKAADGGVRELQGASGPNVKTVRNLMLRPVGVVSITAAEDGRSAIATYKGPNPAKAGSAFTVAMLRLWYNQDATYASWEQFFPVLKTETGKASGGQHLARAFQILENGMAGTTVPVAESGPPRYQASWEQLRQFTKQK